jgi:hypothetical protein
MPARQPKADLFVTVVAPLVGSGASMVEFLRELSRLLVEHYTNYEIVLIDSLAEEATIGLLMNSLKELACVRILRLSQRTNLEVMLFAGLEAAIGDYVVIMVPTEDSPRAVVELVDVMLDGNDIVCGISEVAPRRGVVAALGARLFYWYGRRYLGIDIPPNSTHLVGMNRRSVNALTRIKGRYRHVRQLTRQVGFKNATYRYRPVNSTSPGKRRGLAESYRLAKEIVVSYSQHPLRAVSTLGLIASAVNLAYAIYAIGVYLFDRRVSEGWTTLSLELAVMFFILFIILSVLCEYIGRILEETRAQPAYHIMEELSSTVLVADETRRNVTT